VASLTETAPCISSIELNDNFRLNTGFRVIRVISEDNVVVNDLITALET